MLRARPHPLLNGAALITGASSGIGRALALQAAPLARRLILVARREDRLAALRATLIEQGREGLEVILRPADLADPEALANLIAGLEAEGESIDVLINNAGIGDITLYEFASWEKTEAMIRLNILALSRLTHALLPGMMARGAGGILNISSGFGFSVVPGFAAYAASKHFVTAFTEALRMELSGTGIIVTQSCPGPVATEFEQVAENPTGVAIPGWVQISPEACARASLRAFLRRRARAVPGWPMKLMALVNAVAPRPVKRLFFRPVAPVMRRQQSGQDRRALTKACSE